MKTEYQVIVLDNQVLEDYGLFGSYDEALAEAERLEDGHEVHIHQLDNGEVVGCLWDNEFNIDDIPW